MQSYEIKNNNQFIAWLMVLLVALFYGYEFILRVAPSTMFNELSAFYKINATAVNNIAIFYSLAYTPMQLIVGPLFDKVGIRKLLLFAIFCCALGSYLLSTISVIAMCKFSLFIIGFGSAFAFVGVLKLASATINPKYLGLASGITTAFGMLSAIFGQSIASYVNTAFGWQTTWFIYAFSGMMMLLIVACLIKEPKNKISHDKQTSFLREIWLLTKNRNVLFCGLIGSVLYMPLSVFGSLWGITFITNLNHEMTTVQASGLLALLFLGMIIGGPLSGYINSSFSAKKLLIRSSLIVVVLFGILLFLPNNYLFGPLLLLIGLLCGPEVLSFSMAVENSPSHLAGSAVAFVNFILMAITGLMQYIVGVALDYFWDGTVSNGVSIYDADAYRFALSVIPLISFLLIIVAIFIIKREEKSDQSNVLDDGIALQGNDAI